MAQEPLTVWNEITISQSGIGITLYSESNNGAVVEDETWFTFDELQAETGEIHSLNLSDETDDLMAQAAQTSRQQKVIDEFEDIDFDEVAAELEGEFDESQESDNLPEEGDIVRDANPPKWSENDKLEVIDVLENVKAEDYVIQGRRAGEALSEDESTLPYEETVAQANPSHDSDDPVVMCEYVNGANSGPYAFPLGRLEQ